MQDGGRPGYRRFGVPPGGAFDRGSLMTANALLGNDDLAPALELPIPGGLFEALDDVSVALAGAVAEPHGGGVLRLMKGELLRIDGFRDGVRIYLGVPGGFVSERVLASVSGQAVRRGDTLEFREDRIAAPKRLEKREPISTPLRYVAGPQWNEVGTSVPPMKVSLDSNRTGVRLEGPSVGSPPEIVSEPATPGVIQVTGGGQVIILGPDGPTIGGYCKLGVIIDADLDRVGQLGPGDDVELELVTMAEAVAASQARRIELEKRLKLLRIGV